MERRSRRCRRQIPRARLPCEPVDSFSEHPGAVTDLYYDSSVLAALEALVFSQFTRFLELIEWRLKREGISAATVLGSMPIVSRTGAGLLFFFFVLHRVRAR